MRKYFILSFILLLYCFTSEAQSIENSLSQYAATSPTEKLHLHTDKQTYLPGQTIWFKAYLLSVGLPSTVSTNLYVDLVDGNGKIIEHKTLPILSSTADNHFKLPDTLPTNNYILRAYTSWQLNFDTAFIYHKTITVINNTEVTIPSTQPEVTLQFFAEGGNMVSGLYNYVAFKATQNNGLPYSVKAAIKNNKAELIDSIETIHNGMGLLKFTPEKNETYTAEWKDNRGQYRKTPLPTAQISGVLLHTQQVNDELYYLISTPSITADIQQLTIVATINQKLVYSAIVKPKQNSINQKINTKNFETGVLQITVFDKNNQPLAERIVFVNNNNYSFNTQLNITQGSTTKRGRNAIEIAVPDTVSSNLSIAVYDANLEQQQPQTNIYTDLLLQADIKGYIYNAAWYFENNTTEAKQYLDLVMQTNGWRRYNWDDIITQKQPQLKYPSDNYLSIYGKASDANQQPKPSELITLIVQTADSTKNWYTPVTNKEGFFTQSGLIFYDTATVFYKVNNTKDKTTGIGFAKDYNGLLHQQLQITMPQWLAAGNSIVAKESTTSNYTQMFLQQVKNKNPEFEQTAKVLNEVVVKSGGWHNWKNDPLLKMDEKYTGMYRGIGPNTWAFDVAHDTMAWAKMDIYNYLFGKVPFLRVYIHKDGSKYFTTEYSNNNPPPLILFVNESEVEKEYLGLINIEDIAYIKYYQKIAWRQGLPPALSIYLKKGDEWKTDKKSIPSNLSTIKVTGYSPVKEFYSPDYSIPNAKHSSTDLRSTLLWQPYIITDKENNKATINFYNNDISTKLKIVIEGMNEEGKLIHVEKIIE